MSKSNQEFVIEPQISLRINACDTQRTLHMKIFTLGHIYFVFPNKIFLLGKTKQNRPQISSRINASDNQRTLKKNY